MKANQFIGQAERDAQLIMALSSARYALCRHHSLVAECEGEKIELNFTHEIQLVTGALQALGIDTSVMRPPLPPDSDV